MIKKYAILICLLIFLGGSLNAQQIHISANNQSLSEVLIQLRDSYDMSFSFNDAQLQKYTVTLNREFKSADQALDYLLENFPLAYEKTGDVYVIYPKKKRNHTHPEPVTYILRGRIVEQKTLEPLPYSSVVINGKGNIADEEGYFNHRSSDSLFHLQISHLGYYRLDTLLISGKKHLIELVSSVRMLQEVVITDRLLETFLYAEEQTGVLHMNHKISRFLPGGSNNSVFNLLRMQSGITASAEALESLIIWGSYEGQSRILFDDVLLFGLKNFNDNIGTVNPFVVKDIKLMKAAFEAGYGDCVGGIAEITGIEGNRKKLSMDFSLDPYALNTMLETPLTGNSSLILAFRHTYRNLYDIKEWDLTPNQETGINTDVTLEPDYLFRDLNLKYTFRNEKDVFLRISLLAGQDHFTYNVDEMAARWFQLERNTSESSLQKGASLVAGKNFKNGLNLKFGMSFSGLDTEYENDQKVVNTFTNNIRKSASHLAINSTTETQAKLESTYAINSNHQIEGALSWVHNNSLWKEDTAGINFIDQDIRGNHFTLMAQDRITFEKFKLIPGIRVTRVPNLEKTFLEPRLSASFEITQHLNFNLATGLYRQFLTKNSVEDEYSNYRYMWTVANESDYPVLKSKHFAASLTMDMENTQMTISPFYKTTQGLTRYVNFRARDIETLSKGDGRSHGVDFYLKQNFMGHTTWVSYTLSDTKESFEHFPDDIYLFAPHDQRHELKLALLLDFNPLYFSTNYVYGSGFPSPSGLRDDRIPYHRVDAALTGKFKIGNFYGEAGISILNVFDRENLLYNNLERIPSFQTTTIKIYQQSVPFTPGLYLRVGF